MVDRMKDIVRRLNEASHAYYNGLGELMTDFEWDALFDELKTLEEQTGITVPDSPTIKVSADEFSGKKEVHEFAALSLAKTKSVSDIAKWASGKSIWISWKLDGLTLIATYDGGRLTKLVTRGDGHIGTNITHLAGSIDGVKRSIECKEHLVIRGEAVISYSDFEAYLASSGEEFANPRNLASGSLSLKNPDEVAKRNIRWKPFTLVHSERAFSSWGAQMEFLRSEGFSVVEHEKISVPAVENISAVIDVWTKKVVEKINPYPVDGLVVVYDDVDFASTGSVTGHHATRSGIAFKWQDESVDTKLKYIEWSSSVGSITPVAVFESVDLEGTVVKRASLCNVSECERLGIGAQGTVVRVIKANKIIPKVVSVVEKVGDFEIPHKCPVCSMPTAVKLSETGTKTLQCTNPLCPAKELCKFARFVSKAGLDIDGLAQETIAKFVSNGWIKTFADIFRLVKHIDEISVMEGFGVKSAQNIASSLEKSRVVKPEKFLVALSIPGCGQDVAKKLLSAYPLRELLSVARQTDDLNVFSEIEGIGPVKSSQFVSWCKEEKNISDTEDLFTEIELEQPTISPQGTKCAGLVFVVTGEVSHFSNREAFKEYVVSQGGKVSSAVSAKTSFLVNNDVESLSGKNQKAKKLGVPIISEDEFLRRFG